jgi:hypothetical protein
MGPSCEVVFEANDYQLTLDKVNSCLSDLPERIERTRKARLVFTDSRSTRRRFAELGGVLHPTRSVR